MEHKVDSRLGLKPICFHFERNNYKGNKFFIMEIIQAYSCNYLSEWFRKIFLKCATELD